MTMRLNREIKAYCPDFTPVRQALRDTGATFVEVKAQTDFYYHLPATGNPATGNEAGTRRLKLRIERGQGQLIYYYDRQEKGARTSNFRLWDVADSPVKEMLDAALGIRAVVRKERELWRQENVVFNLDTVEGIGPVFEVEVKSEGEYDVDAQVAEYRRLFGPYLGDDILGSNEDLLPNRL